VSALSIGLPEAASARRARILGGASVDTFFVLGLSLLALVGFRSIYGGSACLLVGLLGVGFGIAVTDLARRWHQPVLAEALTAFVVFVLLGGSVAARSQTFLGVLPTPASISALARAGVFGWKELLTTAPPVGNSANLLAIPFAVGLIGGVTGESIAHRTRSALLPIVGPLLIFAIGILFGTQYPTSVVLQGSVFGAGALAWTIVRYHRFRVVSAHNSLARRRVALAAGLVTLAALPSAIIGAHLPGIGRTRVVLSRYVIPPVDASQLPSPLAGFRQYVVGGALNKSVLFSVTRAPAGSLMPIATMDEYDGIVWGFGGESSSSTADSSDSFQRFGADLPEPSKGATATVTVRVGALTGIWLPDVGQPTSLEFVGTGASQLSTGLRYDSVTATAIDLASLRPGEHYTLTTSIPPTPTASQLASAAAGPATLAISSVPPVLQADAQQWAGSAAGAWGRVMNIANHLLTTGYYSDGVAPNAGAGAPILSAPGHGAGRLAVFLEGGGLVGNAIVGDDEQYAAALTLMSNAIGVPARVVLGAQLPTGGVVSGADVHAWVEVLLNGLGWVAIPPKSFLPTRPAHESPPKHQPNAASSTPVTPPIVSALHPPLSSQLGGDSTAATSRAGNRPVASGARLPAWITPVAWSVAISSCASVRARCRSPVTSCMLQPPLAPTRRNTS